MAHIVSFEMEGLVGREKPYCKELNRDVNIFFGGNGCGKTSLLRILDSAMRTNAVGLEGVPFRSAKVEIYSVDYDEVFTYTIEKTDQNGRKRRRSRELVDEAEPVEVPYQEVPTLEWDVTPDEKGLADIGWRHTYLETYRLLLVPDSRSTQLAMPGLDPSDVQLVSTRRPSRSGGSYRGQISDRYSGAVLKQKWSEYFSRIQSEVRELQQKGLDEILRSVLVTTDTGSIEPLHWQEAYKYARLFLNSQHMYGVLEKREEFRERFDGDPPLQRVITQIKDVVDSIEKTMAPRNKLQKLLNELFGSGKELILRDEDIIVELESGEEIRPANFSSGEKQILHILIAASGAGPSSLIIDEPEISMHIEWQNELVSSIQQVNPKAQLIIATHSPEIMAEIPDDKIFSMDT